MLYLEIIGKLQETHKRKVWKHAFEVLLFDCRWCIPLDFEKVKETGLFEIPEIMV
jgi:hypothetical protein